MTDGTVQIILASIGAVGTVATAAVGIVVAQVKQKVNGRMEALDREIVLLKAIIAQHVIEDPRTSRK